jgi:uncharacterized membrane protein
MLLLIAGLVIFLGAHSVRIFAEGWRTRQRERIGEARWKGLVSLVSAGGFLLMLWGFGMARAAPVQVWVPPLWTRHVAGLLVLLAFILLVAAYLPGTRIKSAIGHPMVAAVKVWALAHLLANGTLADIVLFGSLLAWAILDFAASRRRDRAAGVSYPAIGISRDLAAVLLGAVAWALFAHYAHAWLFGVSPFG